MPATGKLLLALPLFALLLALHAAAQSTNRCTAINLIGESCDVRAICSRCIAASDCIFDIFQGRCDAAVASSIKYCAGDDAVCGNCTVTATKPVCYGSEARCICPSLCAVVTSSRAVCNGEEVNVRLWLTFGAFALVLPLLLYMQRKWNEPGGVQHMLHNYRRRRQQQQRDTTRDLELSTWRDHREQHKLEMRDIELKTCYLMLNDAAASAETGAAAMLDCPAQSTGLLATFPRAADSTTPPAGDAEEIRDPMPTLDGIGAVDESDIDDREAEQQQIAVVVDEAR